MDRISGILPLNKPAGVTSRHVVDRVQALVGGAKVGHAGTLDPLATGVLLVCVGWATRLVEFVQQLPKRYRAEFLLGVRSDTDDIESALDPMPGAVAPSLASLQAALEGFLGRIQQTPPVYSAVHVQGQRAYKLARRGQVVVTEPKWVEIHELNVLAYTVGPISCGAGTERRNALEARDGQARAAFPDTAIARLELEILCGRGTYVRALARDLGRRLGCGAVMAALTRTAVGSFRLTDARDLAQLTHENWQENLRPSGDAVRHLPEVTLPADDLRRLRQGQSVAMGACCGPGGHTRDAPSQVGAAPAFREAEPFAVFDARGEFVAIATYQSSSAALRPRRVLAPATI